MSKKGLGRGLGALLPDMAQNQEGTINELQVKDIKENKYQPRRKFDEAKLQELALSIKEHGVVQPIIVRPAEKGKYELVAGERRWRACKLLGLEIIPAIIKELNEKETSEIALIENLQREDLDAIEESLAFKTLIEEHGLTQDEVAKRVSKSRSFIANSLRLLSLPERVKKMVSEGGLTAGHARTLLGVGNSRRIEELAEKIVNKGMSVRQTEALVKSLLREKGPADNVKNRTDPVLSELENRLQGKLLTKASIKHGDKKGLIEIEYYGDEELQRILEIILGEIAL